MARLHKKGFLYNRFICEMSPKRDKKNHPNFNHQTFYLMQPIIKTKILYLQIYYISTLLKIAFIQIHG